LVHDKDATVRQSAAKRHNFFFMYFRLPE
jgi:hypothetical protein